MMRSVLIVFATLLAVNAAAASTDSGSGEAPVVKVSASLSTQDGESRVFWGPNGRTMWSPSLPAYRSDILTLSYLVENGPQPQRVSAKLDGRSLVDLRKPPWRVKLDTSRLSPGRHVISSDVRLGEGNRMYAIAEYVFFVHEPRTEVKGMVQELGSPTATAGLPQESPARPRPFRGPEPVLVTESFEVTLRSLDTDVDKALREGRPVQVDRSVAFYLQPRPGLDRWAYTITRNGRQIAGAGPMKSMAYLDIAPQRGAEPGLLPGEVTLRAWGVKSNGTYSRPVDVRLVIGESE